MEKNNEWDVSFPPTYQYHEWPKQPSSQNNLSFELRVCFKPDQEFRFPPLFLAIPFNFVVLALSERHPFIHPPDPLNDFKVRAVIGQAELVHGRDSILLVLHPRAIQMLQPCTKNMLLNPFNSYGTIFVECHFIYI